MAKKPKVEAEDTPETRKRGESKKLLEELRENYKLCVEGDRHNRDSYKEALKFCYVPGEQWEDTVKRARGKKRITREFNETRPKVKAVVNHIRSNRPTAKIRGTEQGDVDTAEAMNGLWMNVWNNSNGDNITDFAAETQVAAGMGAWRFETEYQQDSVDAQDICLKSVRNPLCLYPDYASKEQDKSDARFWIYHTKLSKSAFEAKYGNAKQDSFEPEELGEDDPNSDDESVWVCEYWKKVPVKRRLGLLATGETVDLDAVTLPVDETTGQPVQVLKERLADSHKIVQYVCSANAILEGPNDWAGKEFPFVIVYGEYVVVDGKTYWYGLTQMMMDAQRSHNETLTGVFETIAMSPQAKYWTTPAQSKGVMSSWQSAIDENLISMLYNPDPLAPGPPPRVGGADVPAALIQAAQMSRDSINSVSIVPDANVGLTSNESSGRAIRARQDSGLVGTYNFSDNIAKGIGRSCQIFIDLSQKIIDTPRALRILGKDGAEKYVRVNDTDPNTGKRVDLTKGKYDFVVSQGPNVQTQRQEAFDFFSQMATADPALMISAGDIVYRNSDAPGAQEIAERRRLVLPPEIQQAINKDKPLPPEVAAAQAQVQQGMAMVQEQGQLVQQAAQEAQVEKNAADKAKADVAVQQANLKVMEAELNTAVAQFKQLVAETQAKQAQQMAAESTTQGDAKTAETERQSAALIEGVASALENIQAQTAQLLEAQSQQIQALAQFVTQPKAPLSAVTERVNNDYVTTTSDGRRVVTKKQPGGKMVSQQTVQ